MSEITPHISLSPAIDAEPASSAIFQQAHMDLAQANAAAAQAKSAHTSLAAFKTLVVVGTGGSTLGAKMLCALGGAPRSVLFAETVDAHSVRRIQEQIDPETTVFLIISKSGSTLETMALYGLFSSLYSTAKRAEHMWFITDPKPSPLRDLAVQLGSPIIDHPEDIGGRFSILSIVGLLPALFAKVDIDAFIAGATAYQQAPQYTQTIAWHMAQHAAHKSITVMLPYVSQLSYYTYWWRQLWAESLGKNGQFTTPFASIGSVDQHSQLQLWLDGPMDKSFTLISADESDPLSIAADVMDARIYPYAAGRSTADIQHALLNGTLHALHHKQLPVCHMHFSQFAEAELGWLVMHHMAEIQAIAQRLGIHAHGQPAVEVGKMKARELLL